MILKQELNRISLFLFSAFICFPNFEIIKNYKIVIFWQCSSNLCVVMF